MKKIIASLVAIAALSSAAFAEVKFLFVHWLYRSSFRFFGETKVKDSNA